LLYSQLKQLKVLAFCVLLLSALFMMPGLALASVVPHATPPVTNKDSAEQQGGAQVIIRSGDDGRMEEYRMGGQLYMVKISPEKGRPYYLVDTDGDGSLETRRSDLEGEVLIPQWPLLRWK